MDLIEEELAGVVAEVAELETSEIDPAVPFADAGIDSLMAVEIAVDVERRYGIRFAEDELQRLVTFGDLVALTRTKLA
jgi:acyl carrier protein